MCLFITVQLCLPRIFIAMLIEYSQKWQSMDWQSLNIRKGFKIPTFKIPMFKIPMNQNTNRRNQNTNWHIHNTNEGYQNTNWHIHNTNEGYQNTNNAFSKYQLKKNYCFKIPIEKNYCFKIPMKVSKYQQTHWQRSEIISNCWLSKKHRKIISLGGLEKKWQRWWCWPWKSLYLVDGSNYYGTHVPLQWGGVILFAAWDGSPPQKQP